MKWCTCIPQSPDTLFHIQGDDLFPSSLTLVFLFLIDAFVHLVCYLSVCITCCITCCVDTSIATEVAQRNMLKNIVLFYVT